MGAFQPLLLLLMMIASPACTNPLTALTSAPSAAAGGRTGLTTVMRRCWESCCRHTRRCGRQQADAIAAGLAALLAAWGRNTTWQLPQLPAAGRQAGGELSPSGVLPASRPQAITLEMETAMLLDLARCSKGSIRAAAGVIALADRQSNGGWRVCDWVAMQRPRMGRQQSRGAALWACDRK